MLNGCAGCPYKHFSYFNDYYGKPTYAHEWIEAAYDGRKTNLSNGNADFSLYGKAGLEQIIKKGTVYMNILMYVQREFEDAMDDCTNQRIDDNYNSVHAWDEGVSSFEGLREMPEKEDGMHAFP